MVYGSSERIEGGCASFPSGAFEGVWGPVVGRGDTLYVQILLFAVPSLHEPAVQDENSIFEVPPGWAPPEVHLRYRRHSEWRDCVWLGTGGVTPNRDYFTMWTQWQAPGEADEYRLLVS